MREAVGAPIQHELENLLRVISLENSSGSVEVDAFSFRSGAGPFPLAEDDAGRRGSTASVHSRARWENLECYQDSEPRLPMIGGFLSRLLRLVQFEHEGRPVSITGFRLKNLAYWAKYPCPSLFENLSSESLTSACSCRCDFCFLDGMGPSRFRLRHRHPALRDWKVHRLAGKLVRHARGWVLQIKANLEKWLLLQSARVCCARLRT
jgi:hypothetical protein